MNNIILDVDTGEDDSLAILVTLANKLPLHYIITSYGNTSITNSTRNTARLLQLVDTTKVKVIKGSSQPLKAHPFEKNVSAGDFVGKNGICNTYLPPSKTVKIVSPNEADLPKTIASIIKTQQPVDYFITGPCTNFAKVCQYLGPAIHTYVKSVYIMGGAIYKAGNSGPVNTKTNLLPAEFNFYCDPWAAEIVLKTWLPIYLVTWDITSGITISQKQVKFFLSNTKVGKFVIRLINNFLKNYGLENKRNFEANDPVTIYAYLGYGKFQKKKILVVKQGENYGKTILSKNGNPIFYFTLSKMAKKNLINQMIGDLQINLKEVNKICV